MNHGSLPLAALRKEGDLQQQENDYRTVGEFENRHITLQAAHPLAQAMLHLRDPFALLRDPLAHLPPLLFDPLAQAMFHLCDPFALLRDPFAHLPPLLLDPLAQAMLHLCDPFAQAMLHLRDPRQQFFFERPQVLFHDHIPGHGNRRGRSPRACLRRARFHQRTVNFGNHDARRFSSRPTRLPKPAPRL